MSDPGSILLNWLVVFPFIAAAMIAIFPRFMRYVPAHERTSAEAVPAYAGAAVAALSMVACALAGGLAAQGRAVVAEYLWTPDFFQFRLRLDALGTYGLLCVLGALLLGALWAVGAGVRNPVRWAGFACVVGALTGLALAADLVLLYAFWELSALAMWVALLPQTACARRYLTWSHAAGLLILAPVIWLALVSRDTHIYTAGAGLLVERLTAIKWFAAVLFLGVAIKLALAPAHNWLLGVVRAGREGWELALLGSGLVAGAYAGIRIMTYVLPEYAAAGIAWWPIALGLLTAVYGGLRAATARDMRDGAPYVLVAAMGQVALALGVGMLRQQGPIATLTLLLPLALATPLLTACAARRETDSARPAPHCGFAGLVAAWLLAGLPGLAGFWGERALVVAAWPAGWWLGLGTLLGPLLIVVYGIKAGAAVPRGAGAAPPWCVWWIGAVTVIALVLGVVPGLWVSGLVRIVRALTGS